MSLTDTKSKTAKSTEKNYKIYDADGLYIEVPPSGKKRWRFKYRLDGKEKRISLGVYPDVPLKDARERRDEARRIVASGQDPSIVMRSCPISVAPQQDTFRQVSEEWIANRSAVWAASHKHSMDQRLSAYIYPFIGDKPIIDVSALDILAALRIVEKRGALEAARKTLGIYSLICRYAVASARIPSDPCRDLRGALQSRKPGHFAAFTTKEGAAQVVRAVRCYTGAAIVRCALELLSLTFVRPGNIRDATWKDFELENGVWVIPAENMKGRKEHVVPLARQAIAVLVRAQEMFLWLYYSWLHPAGRLFSTASKLVVFQGASLSPRYFAHTTLIVPTGVRFVMAVAITHEKSSCFLLQFHHFVDINEMVGRNKKGSLRTGSLLGEGGMGWLGVLRFPSSIEANCRNCHNQK